MPVTINEGSIDVFVLAALTMRIIRGYFVEYLLRRPDVEHVWRRYIHHPFVMALGNGSLPLDSFKGYIIQDYLYLVSLHYFIRALLRSQRCDRIRTAR